MPKLFRLTALVTVTVLALLATAAPATAREIGANALYTIRFQLLNATAGELVLGDRDPSQGYDRETPQGAAPFAFDDFTLLSSGGTAATVVRYSVEPGVTLVLKGEHHAGFWSSSTYAECWIDVDPGVVNPYSCSVSHDEDNDMDAYVILERQGSLSVDVPSTGPTAPALARLCDPDLRSPRRIDTPFIRETACLTTAITAQTDVLKDEQPGSSTLVNCSPLPASQTLYAAVAQSHMILVGGTVGFRSSWGTVAPGIFTSFDVYLEVTHQQAWTETRTTQHATTVNVPPGHRGWVGVAAASTSVTGDYRITVGSHTYTVRDITVNAPTSSGQHDVVVARVVPLDDPVAACSGAVAGTVVVR